MNEYILETRGLVKSFPGVVAIDKVDLRVRKGEVHALCGENGAGKSTLMMMLSGVYRPDAGEIFVNGNPVCFQSARDAIDHKIGIVFQELSLVPKLSIAENIFFNRQPIKKSGLVDYKKLNKKAKKMLELFQLDCLSPKTPVEKLSLANQQVIEILKAISEDPKLIILDEPTSSLTETETQRLFSNIRKLKARGISFIYISHHLNEIFEIADTVTVLRDGKKVVEKPVMDINEQFLITNMVGREIINIYGERKKVIAENKVVFEAKNVTGSKFSNISFSIREGEIVGFAGLVGAGRTELGRALFGADKRKSGKIYLDGSEISIQNPGDAIKKGIGYMTEDRKDLGLFLDFNIMQNVAANKLKMFSRKGLIQEKQVRESSIEVIDRYHVSATSEKKLVGKLSGGNQQKILLAQWIGIHPRVLIVDEPTRGVDVGAKLEIYNILRALAEETRCGIMLISSDLPEIMGVSDRVYVMKEGCITGELTKQEVSEEAIMWMAAGSERKGA